MSFSTKNEKQNNTDKIFSDTLKKKRGRKPKVHRKIELKEVQSEEDIIIGHLPINITDTEGIYLKRPDTKDASKTKIKELENEITKLKNIINKLKPQNKKILNVFKSDFSENCYCWWCKFPFEGVGIGIPENYHNEKFLDLIGNFCSFNCAKKFNIEELNDNLMWKRNTLLSELYKKTYGEEKEIIPADHWKVIDVFGGPIEINQFRDNFFIVASEHLYLLPYMSSRKQYIEEIPRNNEEKKEEFYTITERKEDYVLKRSKPLKRKNQSISALLKKN